MAKKVYGVKGMIEWHALIPFGKSTMTVKFTGGTLTGYGVSPAKFTTKNRIVQDVIERSNYFKSGRIILMRTFEDSVAERKGTTAKKETITVEKEKIDVASLEDAREVLKDKGIPWTKLKTKEAVLNAADKLNIEFVFE